MLDKIINYQKNHKNKPNSKLINKCIKQSTTLIFGNGALLKTMIAIRQKGGYIKIFTIAILSVFSAKMYNPTEN